MSTLLHDDECPEIDNETKVQLIFSMEKSARAPSTHSSEKSKRTTIVQTFWNWVFESEPRQPDMQPSTPDTGDLVISYPIPGTRRMHLSHLKESVRQNKTKPIDLVEFINSEQHHAVKLKGIPIQSVDKVSDTPGFRVTATTPEDADRLRSVTGCVESRAMGCVWEVTLPVYIKTWPWVHWSGYRQEENSGGRHMADLSGVDLAEISWDVMGDEFLANLNSIDLDGYAPPPWDPALFTV